MKRTVADVVGSAAIVNEEIGGLTVCDEVYMSAFSKTDVSDQRNILECEKTVMKAQTPSGRTSGIGEMKVHELMVKLGIFFAGMTDREFENMLNALELRKIRGF